MFTAPRWALPLILFAFVFAFARGAMLLSHTPLLALANSYDQARYSGCFDLYPDRPDYIRPDTNSPEAPFSQYAFRKNPIPLCYASTELLVQVVAVGVFRADAALTGATRFDVRWLGWIRFAGLLVLAAAFCRAWWRRGLWPAALANAVALALVLLDPANALYFSTFYAEGTALFVLYALLNLVPLWHGEPASAWRALGLAVVAMALALSKIQHLALPLALALVLLAYGWLKQHRLPWQGIALLAGAVVGSLLQFGQLGRGDVMMTSIRSYNRADVVFTALLPQVGDPAATLARLGLPANCLAYFGKLAWQLPGLAEDVCPGIGDVGRTEIVRELLREPVASARLATAGVRAMHPWLAPNLGVVEGEILGKLPQEFFSLSRPLEAQPLLRYGLFALPLLALPFALRRGDHWSIFTVVVTAIGPATLGVILLGDGLADVPKQGHLIFNADLLWCVATLAVLLPRRRRDTSAEASD